LESEKLLITPSPHSSIAIFGRGVIRNYADNFGDKFLILTMMMVTMMMQIIFLERSISKSDGLILEMFEKPIFHEDGFVQHGKKAMPSPLQLQLIAMLL